MPKAKQIGNRLEREVATLFSDWWGREFSRTPNSGALRWGSHVWTFGDILPPEDFPCILECKRRSPIEWHLLFDPELKQHEHHPLSWWQQAQDDALRAYEQLDHQVIHPLVVCKSPRRGCRLFLESDLYVSLGGRELGIPASWVTHPEHTTFVILDLTAFFNTVYPDRFALALRGCVPRVITEAKWAKKE